MVHEYGEEELEEMSRKSQVLTTWAIVLRETYRAANDEIPTISKQLVLFRQVLDSTSIFHL
jgi:hypothetical protein